MPRSWRWEFLLISVVHGVLQTLAPREYCADGNLVTIDFDYSARLFKKSSVPASWFQTPRPHKDAPFDHHRPNADDAVGLRTGADAEDLAVANRGHDRLRETALYFHVIRATRTSITSTLFGSLLLPR